MCADVIFNVNILQMSEAAFAIEVNEIITKSSNISCDLDALPNWLFKECVDQLLSLIIAIINRSMAESVVMLCLKSASIAPLLKRSGLEKEDKKNCRHNSNLPFICNLIGKEEPRSIEEHLEHNDIYDSYQSADTRRQSTETVPLPLPEPSHTSST